MQQNILKEKRENVPQDLEPLLAHAPLCDPLITTELQKTLEEKHAALAVTMLPVKQLLDASELLVPSLWGIVLGYTHTHTYTYTDTHTHTHTHTHTQRI
jgi:hypothetical protein